MASSLLRAHRSASERNRRSSIRAACPPEQVVLEAEAAILAGVAGGDLHRFFDNDRGAAALVLSSDYGVDGISRAAGPLWPYA